MPSATLIEFNQDIIQNRQSRGIAVRNLKGKQELKFSDWENHWTCVKMADCFVLFLIYRTIENKLTTLTLLLFLPYTWKMTRYSHISSVTIFSF